MWADRLFFARLLLGDFCGFSVADSQGKLAVRPV
jgi:hypothetical protein